ncbi:MAG: arginine deiminase family protein [Chloroflexota bacterium]
MITSTSLFNSAAYGGEGWSPRTATHFQEIGKIWGSCGIENEWCRLKAVLLHRPGDELQASIDDPDAVQMLAPLDISLAQAQHDGIAQAYQAAGVQVHYIEPVGTPTPNQMFAADLMFMTPEGVILARPASTVRAGEERWVARRLADLGIPIMGVLRGNGTFEGADAMWLDSHTVILGRGLRTNVDGAKQVSDILNAMGVTVVQVDLPFGTMHLMGMLRIVDQNLAIAWPKRLALAGVEALRERGYQVAFLPDEDEATLNGSFNIVTLGPRKILMAAGSPVVQSFYESLDIECITVPVDELRKAAGAIGCLTGVVEREEIRF